MASKYCNQAVTSVKVEPCDATGMLFRAVVTCATANDAVNLTSGVHNRKWEGSRHLRAYPHELLGTKWAPTAAALTLPAYSVSLPSPATLASALVNAPAAPSAASTPPSPSALADAASHSVPHLSAPVAPSPLKPALSTVTPATAPAPALDCAATRVQPTAVATAAAAAGTAPAGGQRIGWDSFPVLSVLSPLELMDALHNLHTHLVLTDFSVPRPTTPQRRVIVCSSAAAQRAIARALSAFEPRRNQSVVIEGLPRETTAEEVAQLLKRYCGAACATNATVEKVMPVGDVTGAAAAVVTCPPLSDDCDDIVTALHGKRLISLRGPLCVYALELQHTKWAPNMEDF
jgi:hypothetical protein